MNHVDAQLAQFLLARITWQLERISEKQHWLARRKVLLQEQATRLRLGESPALVHMELSRPRTALRERNPQAAMARPSGVPQDRSLE